MSLQQGSSIDTARTAGEFRTEREACNVLDTRAIPALDRPIGASAFRVYAEVKGTTDDGANVRIDRILVPTPEMLRAGWNLGAVGIEAKKSGVRLGPAVAQSLDYLRASWSLCPHSDANCLSVIRLGKVFLFPMDGFPGGNLGSVMSQQRIGAFVYVHREGPRGYSNIGLRESESRWLVRVGEGSVQPSTTGFRVGSR